jgi:cellulose synthase/poly-beta-1,6-N-acetylglucosamine synthase-like glycosyltransferase
MVYFIAIILSLLALLHTYLIFPFYVSFRYKKLNPKIPTSDQTQFPHISIIMAVYNEELVLDEKLKTISSSNYPKDKLNVFIGSDNSTDHSNEIITSHNSPFLSFFFPFGKRRGKTNVINNLVEEALKIFPQQKDHILIFTDANVFINEETIKELVQPFADQEIDLVDANMNALGLENKGISRAEGMYINMESKLKFQEGSIWGMTMGPFGGCFALRSTAFKTIPPNLIVDDLYLALDVLTKGKKVITSLDSKCFEKVSSELYEELKRKIRISSGNWQLLKKFPQIWFPPFNSTLSFIFISHKLFRWLSPFFILIIYLASMFWQSSGILVARYIFIGLNFIFVVPFFLDQILTFFKIPLFLPRKAHYFLMMNFGLLLGFLKYLCGLNSNIWEPPNRK